MESQEYKEFKENIKSREDYERYRLFLKDLKYRSGEKEKPTGSSIILQSFIGSIPLFVAIIAGIITYITTNKSNNATAKSAIDLEKKKFTYQLIIDAVKEKTLDQKNENLRALQKINVLDSSIDISGLNGLVYTEKLDSVHQLIDSLHHLDNSLSLRMGKIDTLGRILNEKQSYYLALEEKKKKAENEYNLQKILLKEMFGRCDSAKIIADSAINRRNLISKEIHDMDSIVKKYSDNPSLAVKIISEKLGITRTIISQQQTSQYQQQQQLQRISNQQQQQQKKFK